MKYTTILHEIRLKFDLTMNEYAVIDCIYHLQLKNGWCNCSKNYLSNWLGITSRSIFTIIKKLESKKLIQKKDNLLKTTKKWTQEFSDYENISQSNKDTYEETSHQPMKKLHSTYEETSHNNKTYKKKDNKTLTKVNGASTEKKEYGNKVLNEIIKYAHDNEFSLQGSQKQNRQYAWNLYKSKGIGGDIKKIKFLIDGINKIRGKPYTTKIADFKDLYYNWGKLLIDIQSNNNSKTKIGVISDGK